MYDLDAVQDMHVGSEGLSVEALLLIAEWSVCRWNQERVGQRRNKNAMASQKDASWLLLKSLHGSWTIMDYGHDFFLFYNDLAL